MVVPGRQRCPVPLSKMEHAVCPNDDTARRSARTTEEARKNQRRKRDERFTAERVGHAHRDARTHPSRRLHGFTAFAPLSNRFTSFVSPSLAAQNMSHSRDMSWCVASVWPSTTGCALRTLLTSTAWAFTVPSRQAWICQQVKFFMDKNTFCQLFGRL